MNKKIFRRLHRRYGLGGLIALAALIFFIGGLGASFFERLLLPYLSTLPIFREFNWLQSEAPILITRREEIRITEGVNQAEVTARVKNSLVTIYLHQGRLVSGDFRIQEAFSGVVVSTDGLVVVPVRKVLPNLLITVVTSSGEAFPAAVAARDSFTGLALLKIGGQNLNVIGQGFSRDLLIGDKLILLDLKGDADKPRSSIVTVTAPALAEPSLIKSYNFQKPNTTLLTDFRPDESNLGSILANRDGALVGIITRVSGEELTVLRSEELQLFLDNYLDDGAVSWPQLALTYQVLGRAQSKLMGLPKDNGVLIKNNFGALREDDFVFAVNGTAITEKDGFQELLLAKPEGSEVKLKLIRDGEEKEVVIKL